MNGTPDPSHPTGAPADSVDLIVLGAGAGGMTAALVGALEGLRVVLIERTDCVGGTTATSSGTVWIPDNPHQRDLGVRDDAAAAMTYLDALVGDRADRWMREAFVAQGPRMVEYLEARSEVRFQAYPHHPDYRQELPGAATGGRPLEPLSFDGRLLGAHFRQLRWPIRELMLPGGLMVTRGEAARLLRGPASWDAVRLGATLAGRLLADRLRYRRGTRLVLGNALAARLYKGLLDHGVDILLEARVSQLLTSDDGAVCGVVVSHQGGKRTLRARRGVVLAGGGFPADQGWRERHLPSPTPRYTAACEACTGETIRLGLEAGAALGQPTGDNALWFPSSIATRRDGSTAVYPHIVLDRAKPGLIAVNAAGRRFVNEAASYHEFTRGMYAAHPDDPSIPALLVCDRRFLWKYGLGMVWPHSMALRRHIRGGYLLAGATLADLAQQAGIDPAGLARTVAAVNEYAATGKDPDFHKGESLYDRNNGDSAHQPNPCLGPIATPPFYAVRVYPTPLATSLGLRTDADARVLGGDGRPIAGLYACGADMHSPFGGEYPGAGAQLGPAMTFGYVAARHAANIDLAR
ncbi:FAD-dependent oxidoreductase [Castellaniella sp. S9]|uniref:FAD-dependent oxidoreductase n=1 Tax=Castellaniella sp. S9 TaxID=2993652 RepID=UPI0022B4E20D|nr:FAD-dependent oxidoreductase [Castellaniella sp. S9]